VDVRHFEKARHDVREMPPETAPDERVDVGLEIGSDKVLVSETDASQDPDLAGALVFRSRVHGGDCHDSERDHSRRK
jgi:hypothetical protein